MNGKGYVEDPFPDRIIQMVACNLYSCGVKVSGTALAAIEESLLVVSSLS